MSNYYSYTGGNHPHAPSTIDVFDPSTGSQTEQINNTYDTNGNLKQISHDDLNSGSSTTRDMYWDEQNRLQAIAENGIAYHYVYDASGDRVLKSSGSTANLVVNGEQVTALTNPGNYTMYPSGYLVVGTHDYTKHYYAGSQRIATRMGDLSTVHNFQSFASGQGTTGSSDALKQQGELETKKQFLQKQLTDIYAKAKLGKPNFNIAQATIDPAEAACQAEYNALLQYWYSIAMNGGGNRDCYILLLQTYEQNHNYCQTMEAIKKEAKCYINMDPKKLPIWWYHPDHLGSSSYLTDFSGLPSHYYNYLPFGEEMVSQNNSSYNNVYRFSGKELDQETGLSYFGARYYDPKYSFWLSIDPLAEVNPHKSPYNYCSNNPINRTDPTGMLDDWYIDQNGAYLGQDGSTTNNIRMINRVDYNDVSEANGGTTSEAATQQLQSGSQNVTVDDAQIQGMMQDIHSATKSVENQMYIVLDKSNATIKGVLGSVGKDGEATIDSSTRTRKVDGVEQTIPGLFATDADGKKWPLLGAVHTHNLIRGSSTGTGSSSTLGGSTTENGFGTSAQDVATAKSLGIPIYAIDSWNYGPRGQATIGRALPNGTQTSGVGTTAGSRGQTNASSLNVGAEALNYRVTGKTTR